MSPGKRRDTVEQVQEALDVLERSGNWQITSQTLRNASTGGDAVVTYTGTYNNLEASAKVKFSSAAGTISIGARLGSYSGGVPAAGYVAEISNTGLVKLWRVNDWAELGSYQIANYQSGTFTTLLLSASGSALVVKVDGTTRISANDSTFTSGSVGMWSYDATAANQHVIDDFNLVLLGQGSLPGGSLAAWWEGVKAWIGQVTGGGKVAAPAGLKSQMAIRQRELTLTDPPSGQIYRSYYFVGSVRVAVREFTGSVSVVSYIVTDHLGSTSMILDASGVVIVSMGYKPWGELRYPQQNPEIGYKYTGQLQLDIGIYHYGARAYDPLIGRFLSADSIIPGAGNPMAWDRYAYGLNSPVRYVDPTGHSACDGPNGGDPDCQGLQINRRHSPTPSTSKLPLFNLPNSFGPPAPPAIYQEITGGMTIGMNTGPVSLNYYYDYQGSVANSGNSNFYINNYDPTVPCLGIGCIPQLVDTSLRVIGPFMPRPEKPSTNNVKWHFTIRHSNGTMSPGDIDFSTTIRDDKVFVRSLTFENGNRTVYVGDPMNIDPRFGSSNSYTNVPQGFSGQYPLIISIAIQCSGCVNLGNGPTSFVWNGKEIMSYISIH